MSAVSNDNTPAVTIIALCYNHKDYVIECLDSIRAQTYTNTELIIMDDCSKDESVSIINDWISLHGIKCTFIAHTVNLGLCRTLNEALTYANGEFISMIATDDAWEPNKIEHQMKVMWGQSEQVAVVYSDTAQMDESGKILPKTFLEAQRPGFILPSGRIFSSLVDRNFVHPLATLIRRKAIESVGGYDERLVVEDYDMWIRLAERYDFVFCPGIVARYRIVSSSMTRTIFVRPTPNHSYGRFLLYEKWLPSELLSHEQKKRWSINQWEAARSLYVHGDPRARKCLWKAFIRTRKPRALIMALACSLGISRSTTKRIICLVGGRRDNEE